MQKSCFALRPIRISHTSIWKAGIVCSLVIMACSICWGLTCSSETGGASVITWISKTIHLYLQASTSFVYHISDRGKNYYYNPYSSAQTSKSYHIMYRISEFTEIRQWQLTSFKLSTYSSIALFFDISPNFDHASHLALFITSHAHGFGFVHGPSVDCL